jgi:hypothetical protein
VRVEDDPVRDSLRDRVGRKDSANRCFRWSAARLHGAGVFDRRAKCRQCER